MSRKKFIGILKLLKHVAEPPLLRAFGGRGGRGSAPARAPHLKSHGIVTFPSDGAVTEDTFRIPCNVTGIDISRLSAPERSERICPLRPIHPSPPIALP